jgi:hypothetical protein
MNRNQQLLKLLDQLDLMLEDEDNDDNLEECVEKVKEILFLIDRIERKS